MPDKIDGVVEPKNEVVVGVGVVAYCVRSEGKAATSQNNCDTLLFAAFDNNDQAVFRRSPVYQRPSGLGYGIKMFLDAQLRKHGHKCCTHFYRNDNGRRQLFLCEDVMSIASPRGMVQSVQWFTEYQM